MRKNIDLQTLFLSQTESENSLSQGTASVNVILWEQLCRRMPKPDASAKLSPCSINPSKRYYAMADPFLSVVISRAVFGAKRKHEAALRGVLDVQEIPLLQDCIPG
ncbi:hypothetical protein FQR65_LT18605 [Abscondita terminalis]|nr:hypothetical protein FQR65_LT18605 [Abscondita terminalis]